MGFSEENAFRGRSLLRSLLFIALPLTMSAGVRYGVELSNVYWVGKLGVAALSIVTGLGTFLSLSKMFAGFTSAGTSAVVGRMIGEDRRNDAIRTAQKVTAVALALGCVIALIALAASPFAFDALSFQGATRVEARKYLYVLLTGLPFSFGMMSMNGVLVGLGKPRASMAASTVSLIVAFVTTPVLLVLLHRGVWSAGVAQIAGDICGYLIGLRFLQRHAGPLALPWRTRFTRLRELWPVVRVGAPLTADAVLHGLVWFGLISFLSKYGGEYVAAQGAEERFTQILNLPTEGVAPATGTLVGYLLGQNRRRDAVRAIYLGLAVILGSSFGGVVILRMAPANIVGWICSDANFVHVGTQLLAIASISLVFLGGRDVLEAAFGGIGNTVPPVIIGLSVALTRFPLAYLLAVRWGFGGLGVTWAVTATIIVQTIVLATWMRSTFARDAERITSMAPPPLVPSDPSA